MISRRAWTATHTDIRRGQNRTKKQNLQPSPDGEGRRSGRGAPILPHLVSPLPGGKVFCSKHPGRCCPRDLTSPHRSRSLSSRTLARRTAQTGVFAVFGRVLGGPRLSLSLHFGAGPRTSVPSTPRGRRRVAGGGIAALLVPAPLRRLPPGHLG